MKKRWFSILLCMCVILLFPISGNAAILLPECMQTPSQTGLENFNEMKAAIGEIKVGDVDQLEETLNLLQQKENNTDIGEQASSLWSGAVAECFAGGNGSKENPYQIASAEQLAKLASDVSDFGIKYTGQYFELTCNIVINEDVLIKVGAGNEAALKEWKPIGNLKNAFEGVFNGNGYTVSGVYVSDEGQNYVGLFGTVNAGVIGNLILADTYVNGGSYVGGICGYMGYGAVIGCMQIGEICGMSYTGGICGSVYSGYLYGCYNAGEVHGVSDATGGICARYIFSSDYSDKENNLRIEGCINTSYVFGERRAIPIMHGNTPIYYEYKGGFYVGGIVGTITDYSYEGEVYRCMNYGTIKAGQEYVGGIYGGGSCDVSSCANLGTIIGEDIIGGICGASTGDIKNSYNAGNVQFKGDLFGSICDVHRDNINCYFLEGGYCPYSTEVTAGQFASGEITYLLNESANCGTVWYQSIGVDPYPVLDNSHDTVRYDGSEYKNGHDTKWVPNADGVSHDAVCKYCDTSISNETHQIDSSYICTKCGYAVPVDKIKAFVERYYETILERTADAGGITYWVDELVYGRKTAAKVASSFIFSKEFIELNLSNEEFLDRLYAAFFDRTADASGKRYWMNYLEKGITRNYVTAQFINSVEFEKICAEYGMQRGSIALTRYVDQNPNLTMYVIRCYEEILNRPADPSGLEYWCKAIYTGEKEATAVAKNFVSSNEFIKKNLSDSEYMKVLYRAFMNREADAGGLNYWVGRLENGESRNSVLNTFAGCKEFQDILRSFGL